MRIVVLAGGLSMERNVSLSSGTRICRALRERGHQAVLVDMFLGLEGYDGAPESIFDAPDGLCGDFSVAREEPDLDVVRASRKDKSENIFGKAKVRISREKMQASLHFFRGRVSSAKPKIMKVRGFRRFRFGLLTVFSVAVRNSGRRVPYIVKHGPDRTYRSISRSTRIRRDERHP